MTQFRFTNKPASNGFNNLMDDFLATVPSFLRDDLIPARQQVPVNISERENEYLLEAFAPGFEKESFTINLDKNILTIAGSLKKEENKSEKQVRREFKAQSFKRSFTVDDNIDADRISAGYVNGVLTLNLPKKDQVKPSSENITIL